MKLLFVGETDLKNLWQKVSDFLEISSQDNNYWVDIRLRILRSSIEKLDYEVLILVDVEDIDLMDLIVIVASKRKPFVIVSERSEAKLKEDLLINDIDGGLEFFHYIERSSDLKENVVNISKMIKEIFS